MAVCDRYATSRAMICQVLAADCGCPEAALTREGVTIVAARPETARFRFPQPSRALTILTTGVGVVIRCAPEWAFGL